MVRGKREPEFKANAVPPPFCGCTWLPGSSLKASPNLAAFHILWLFFLRSQGIYLFEMPPPGRRSWLKRGCLGTVTWGFLQASYYSDDPTTKSVWDCPGTSINNLTGCFLFRVPVLCQHQALLGTNIQFFHFQNGKNKMEEEEEKQLFLGNQHLFLSTHILWKCLLSTLMWNSHQLTLITRNWLGPPCHCLPGALSKATDRDAHMRQALIWCGKFQDET